MRSFYLPLLALAMAASSAHADQIDIVGPPDSELFGTSVTVLPNGNIVVTDPEGPASVGFVYLYSPDGILISTVSGSSVNDHVGSEGVVVLANGNYLILSPDWHNGSIEDAGAVTWADADSGISGVVSAANSLIGTSEGDHIGENEQLGNVIALANGNYVVGATRWDNGSERDAGAVTWADGSIGVTGPVSSANSLIGVTEFDGLGKVVALADGNYLSVAESWHNGAIASVGAVTWINGEAGLVGVVSAANSLIGTTASDRVGTNLTVLANGNYVVGSPKWNNGGIADVGAVTWVNAATGLIGTVSPANSLIGTSSEDKVGMGITALSNGNYVVFSSSWSNAAVEDAGAATWANGQTGLVGVVSPANSLVGTNPFDRVGHDVTALANGNYVVNSYRCDHAGVANVGAATWGDGSVGITGAVSVANSLVGSTENDEVGENITALANGNYVIGSPDWDNGGVAGVGAVTWANGSSGLVGVVSAANSLIGSTANDFVGLYKVTALTDGNYVVTTPDWNHGLIEDAGAATWGDGSTGTVGVVSAVNSLVGDGNFHRVATEGAVALPGGNYVVLSPSWDLGSINSVGAVTWVESETSVVGVVSQANSMTGTHDLDGVGRGGVFLQDDGNFIMVSPGFADGGNNNAGAITLARSAVGLDSFITPDNSVIGTDSFLMSFDYDLTRSRLVVGRPISNIVSLFTLPVVDPIFANGFD